MAREFGASAEQGGLRDAEQGPRPFEIFLEDALLWTDDDYLGPLHVQTSAGTEVIEFPLPEWAGLLQVAEVYAKGLAAYATPTKAFLDAFAASGNGAVGHPDAATALASHHLVDRAYASAAAGGIVSMRPPNALSS